MGSARRVRPFERLPETYDGDGAGPRRRRRAMSRRNESSHHDAPDETRNAASSSLVAMRAVLRRTVRTDMHLSILTRDGGRQPLGRSIRPGRSRHEARNVCAALVPRAPW
jgi:hypothetical protein